MGRGFGANGVPEAIKTEMVRHGGCFGWVKCAKTFRFVIKSKAWEWETMVLLALLKGNWNLSRDQVHNHIEDVVS